MSGVMHTVNRPSAVAQNIIMHHGTALNHLLFRISEPELAVVYYSTID